MMLIFDYRQHAIRRLMLPPLMPRHFVSMLRHADDADAIRYDAMPMFITLPLIFRRCPYAATPLRALMVCRALPHTLRYY